jgi:outer membrane protein assembly factor BamB
MFDAPKTYWEQQTGHWQRGSPSVANDGIMYVTPCGYGGDLYLRAVSPSGEVKWSQTIRDGTYHKPPALGPDGTVYISSQERNVENTVSVLYAFRSTGELKWAFTKGNFHGGQVAVGSEGTVYAILGGCLCAVTSSGQLQWDVPTNSFDPKISTIAPDGTIYLVSDGGRHPVLQAVLPSGQTKWVFKPRLDYEAINRRIHENNVKRYGAEKAAQIHMRVNYAPPVFQGYPAVGQDGTIHIGNRDGNLYAINTDGSLKWKNEIGQANEAGPAIGPDGTIFVATQQTGFSPLYAFAPDGALKWTVTINGHFDTAPAIAPDGTLYIGSHSKMFAFNEDGSIKWSRPVNGLVCRFPAVTSNGAICVTTDWGYLYLIQ